MQRVVTALVMSGLTFVANTAHAQERGRIGLSMGYPERVDLLWHATEHIAIRPGVSWHHTSFDNSGLTFSFSNGVATTTSSTSSDKSADIGIGVNALLSVGAWENVHAYVAPGYEYRRSRTTQIKTTVLAGRTERETFETRGHGHVVSGTFGVRYVPHERFGVFGESGIEYSNSRTKLPGIEGLLSGLTSKVQMWGQRRASA
jgi:hypothetical protein